jgi:hypothetical protein
LVLPSGLLAFGLRGRYWTADERVFEVIATVDQDGQNLTERFALSPDDVCWKLSPDGTKLATYREACNTATSESEGSFHVYDLSTGKVTPLAMPPQVWLLGRNRIAGPAFTGDQGSMFWSPDSQAILYTYMADVNRGDDCLPPNLMVTLARVPSDGSEANFTDMGFGDCAFSPIPGREAVIFAGPYRTSFSSRSDLYFDASLVVFDLRTGTAGTVANTANQVRTLGVSSDGRYVAYECLDDRADGAEVEYEHCDLWILDLETGVIQAVTDHSDKPTSIARRSYLWSPVDDVLAVVLENKNSDGTTVKSVYFYDASENRKTTETAPISRLDLLGATWSGDGLAFFLSLGPSIYRVSAATGELTAILTLDTPGTGLATTP